MNKISFFLWLVIMSPSSIAAITVTMEGKNYDCEKASDQIIHCQKGDQKILVLKNFMGYAAVEKTGDELPKMKWLSKVAEDDKILYEIPKYPGFGGGEGNFKKPDTISEKISTASGVISNLKRINDPWAKEFVAFSEAYVKKETAEKMQLQIVDGDGANYSCSKGKTRKLSGPEIQYQITYNTKIQCSYYACKDSNGKSVLAFIPSIGSYASPHFLTLEGEKSQLRLDGFKVLDPASSDHTPIYDLPKIERTSRVDPFTGLDQKLFLPSKYQKNETTFAYFSSPMVESTMDVEEKQCSGENEVTKMLVERRKISEQIKEDVASTELAHYLTMTNGQMISMLIDASKAKGMGCRYGEMILSREAQDHLNYLEKAKPKPVKKYVSAMEVQELFKRAKNMSDIPFGYKYDGCYARAHVMARRFEAMGIPTEKVWIQGALSVPETDIKWAYHVAPVINVKDKNGVIQKYVIDPSLNDKAVTVDEWVNSISKNVKGGIIKTAFPFPTNATIYQRTSVAFSSTDIYLPDADENSSEGDNMAMATQTLREYSEVLKGREL